MTIKILSFSAWLKANADLFEALSKSIKPCDNCEGAGECECDMGHFHDCPECDGTGNIDGIEDAEDQLRTIYEHTRTTEIARLLKFSSTVETEQINEVPDNHIEITESLRDANGECL